jgi:hypothetical protein
VTTPAPPGGFTAVVTTVAIGPAGGTIGPVSVDGADLIVNVPAGTFPVGVTITVTAPDLTAITRPAGFIVVAGAGIEVNLDGSPYPGTFLNPINAIFQSPAIRVPGDVEVWNGTSFVTDPDSTTAPGVASVNFDTDPDFAVESPVSAKATPVPGATIPVTGKPLLGEGILAGALVLAGAGGVATSRRRRVRGLSTALPRSAYTQRDNRGGQGCEGDAGASAYSGWGPFRTEPIAPPAGQRLEVRVWSPGGADVYSADLTAVPGSGPAAQS